MDKAAIRFTTVPSLLRSHLVNVKCHGCKAYIGTCRPENAAGLHAAHLSREHRHRLIVSTKDRNTGRRVWSPA